MVEEFMEKMMSNMQPGEKEGMMEKMMGKFFEQMKPEDKRKMMESMMSKMIGGMNMSEMMPMMMSKMMGRGGEGESSGKPGLANREDFKPWECCPCRDLCEKGFEKTTEKSGS